MLAVVGVAVGTAAAFAVTRVMASLLYEVTATDPVTFTLVPAVLGIVVLAACLVPALRATKINPPTALRTE